MPARTATFEYITKQLEFSQQSGLSAILCDIPNIGKTFTARYYVQCHRNAIYVDCSQVKTKLKLVRKIATEFGVGSNGRYSDVYEDLVYYLRSIDTPLIILDEAGDLQYEAFLELKALWNATERCCAWYMMGADGLKAKINRSIECKKVGYTEMLSRYGDRYSKVTPDDSKEREKFLKDQASVVAKVNAPEGADIATLASLHGNRKTKKSAGMMTKMEMQYMDAVIQINRRQRNNEVDWEQRRYELAKAALFVAPVLHHDREEMTAELIAKYAVKIADAVVSELIETEK